MQVQGAMSLAAMQKDGHGSNCDVGYRQGEQGNLPPRPIQVAIC